MNNAHPIFADILDTFAPSFKDAPTGKTVEIHLYGLTLDVEYSYSPACRSLNRDIPDDEECFDIEAVWIGGERAELEWWELHEQKIADAAYDAMVKKREDV